jgi:sulfane dehydrogenase subunit SoxC
MAANPPNQQHVPVQSPESSRTDWSRRGFLQTGLATGGAAGVGLLGGTLALAESQGSSLPLHTPSWSQELGVGVRVPYGQPSRFESEVIRRDIDWLFPDERASVNFTPLQDLHGIITPNGLHFARHHAGVPDINPDEHRLLIHGLVQRPLLFTMDELMRFPAVSRIHFIECSGNGTLEWTQAVMPTVQFTHGMIGCSEWTGVRLSTLLDEVGVDRQARWILAESADAAGLARSIPMAKALDDAMVVYAQNGERIRPEQGYPLRLLCPGFEGNANVKWLRRLEVGTRPWMTREETSRYTDLMPDGSARQFTFVNEAKSVITFPSGGQQLRERGSYEIRGLAWSGRGKVKRVDVSVDGGNNWETAKLQQPVLSKCLTSFRMTWTWQGEPLLLQSRVIDESGYVQPTIRQLRKVRGTRSTYHNNAIQTWKLDVEGKVSNVQI